MADRAATEQAATSADKDPEGLLAELLAALTDQLCRGQQPDVERVAARHPEVAAELRRLWAATRMVDGLARTNPSTPFGASQHPAETTDPVSGRSETTTGTPRVDNSLPRRVGNYELLEEIGRGGMGVVYKARQLDLDRIVAVKMLLNARLAGPTEEARFHAEAEAAARLADPHIVPVYEVGEVDDQPYFSMQLIEGTTLAARLDQGPLTPREAAELLIPICRAVDMAHRQGVLHRDLKPSNILIDRTGRPLVSDFGLAKQLQAGQSLTRTGAIVGTPSYIAPEQAAGSRGEVGPASDVYSLGMILYEMLTGRPAFQAPSPVDTVLMVLEQDPLPPRLLNAKADRDLEMVALRCLQKPIALRYASAGELADDLEAYLAGEAIAARSGRFSQVVARLFRETHHAAVLENWGLLWIWHSLVLLVLCVTTNMLHWLGIEIPGPYVALWAVGLAIWAPMVWMLRRRAGPVTFVERQIAHVWGAGMLASVLLFVIEMMLELPVLQLSPVLGLISGMVFLAKAGILSGSFYIQAAALFGTALLMAFLPDSRLLPIPIELPAAQIELPDVGLTLFGFVVAACFFFPGLKYHRLRLEAISTSAAGVAADDESRPRSSSS